MFDQKEIQFLASVIFNPTSVSTLPKEVSSTDFSDVIYYDVYNEVIKGMIEGKTLTIPDLKFKFRDDQVAIALLTSVENASPVNDVGLVYEEILDDSNRRKLKDLTSKIYHSCDSDFTSQELILKLESELLKITTNQESKVQSVSDLKISLLPNLNDRVKRFRKNKSISDIIDLPTGFSQLDKLTLGFQRGNTWVLGAATSDGKTQMAVQLANSVINSGKGVLYFLLEDSSENLLIRFLSLRTGIEIEKIRCGMLTDAQVSTINSQLSALEQGNSLFVDDATSDISEIISRTKFAKIKHKHISLIVVDYIGLLQEKGGRHGNREQELSSVSKALIALAKSCDVAVLSLAQLNTSPENRSDGFPIKMNDIRDSKAIGHDAAVSLFINYPDKYSKEKKFSKKYAQLLVAKNRYGEVNKTIDLTNHARIAKFTEGAPKHEGEKFEKTEAANTNSSS